TGRFLDAPSPTPTAANPTPTPVRMFGRTTAGERQWRILPKINQPTDVGTQFPLPLASSASAELKLAQTGGSKTSFSTLSAADPIVVTVIVRLSGNRTSGGVFASIDAKVEQSSLLTLQGNATTLIIPPAPPNKRVYLELGSILT